jgi:hypothetical protein
MTAISEHDPRAGGLRRDVEVVGVISLAHFFSHFFQFILPPLFPLIRPEFGVGFGELGLIGATCSAFIFLAVGLVGFGAVGLAAILALSGFAGGVVSPSRDMLVRAAAAKSSTGKIFGFVYSGYDLGAALSPPALGFLLDHGLQTWVTPVIAVCLVLVILSALGLHQPASGAPSAAVPARR